jgi:probable rRNA maturation factor
MEARPRAEVSVLLTDDTTVHSLNLKYRGKDRPTDVLSFSQWNAHDQEARGDRHVLGDVVISVETAERQALQAGHTLQSELELLIAHGVLHLLGYDDETDEGAEEMRVRERVALAGSGR